MSDKMNTVIILFLVLIVGLVLSPTVSTQAATAAANLTGAAATVMNLVPLFWVFMIIGIPVGGMYVTLKSKN